MNVNSTLPTEPIIPTAEGALLARNIIRALEQHPGHGAVLGERDEQLAEAQENSLVRPKLFRHATLTAGLLTAGRIGS
jgi:hypothetical protein